MKNSISTFKNASNISWVSGVKKYFFLVDYRGFPIAQTVKNLHAMWETQVWSLGWEDPLEKGMAIHSSILAWKIPWTEEPGGLQYMGLQRAGHNWMTNTFTFLTTGYLASFLFLMETKTKVCLVLCLKFLIGINSWVFIIYLLLCYFFQVHKAENLSCYLLRTTIQEAITILTLCHLFGHTIEMSNNSLRFKDYGFD